MKIKNYPFAKNLITDQEGNICQVILDLQDYEHILEILEDEGLYQAMLTTKEETPLSLETALEELERE
jgi:RelB Antitoxin alpha helical domain